jgi:hypothetical protein
MNLSPRRRSNRSHPVACPSCRACVHYRVDLQRQRLRRRRRSSLNTALRTRPRSELASTSPSRRPGAAGEARPSRCRSRRRDADDLYVRYLRRHGRRPGKRPPPMALKFGEKLVGHRRPRETRHKARGRCRLEQSRPKASVRRPPHDRRLRDVRGQRRTTARRHDEVDRSAPAFVASSTRSRDGTPGARNGDVAGRGHEKLSGRPPGAS